MNDGETRARFEGFLRWTIEVEYPAHARFLASEEGRAFGDYYRSLPASGDHVAIARLLRGTWRGDAGWTARWLATRDHPVVLDAGSGFGTFAMLYASVGAEVLAVDLRPDRLSAAEKRLAFHRETTGESLAVTQLRADLTRPWPRPVDLVWVYNAISHIDPLDPFIAQVREHLKPGGVLVVGDINGANPRHLARLSQVRTEVHQEYVAPDGQRHAYAVERTFSPAEMRQVMERNGLRVLHHEVYFGGLGSLPDPVYHGLVAPLQRQWRLGGRRARRQLVVAGRVS
ncbi:MAG: class I SAM-dependent methyltransferase [Candidatus Eisenbacteria bacterium]